MVSWQSRFLFLLIFDIVAVYAMWYLLNHWQEIWQKITNDLGISSDSTIIDAGKAILNGDIAPGDVYSNHKERVAKEKAEREAASDSTDEDMDTYSEEDSVSSVKENDELADKESSDDESDEVSRDEEYRKLPEEDRVSNSTDASDETAEHDEKVTEEQKDEIDSFLNELIEEDDET